MSFHLGVSNLRCARVPKADGLRHSSVQRVEGIFDEQAADNPPELTVDRIASIFPYPLDAFQRQALEVSMNGKSVVVCAPTGAGKTAVAVAAAVRVLALGKRIIYTTPLKALSNQKLFELQVLPHPNPCGCFIDELQPIHRAWASQAIPIALRIWQCKVGSLGDSIHVESVRDPHSVQAIFGEDHVGLRTGDVSINAGADVMIMTTEIFRNITYRALLEAADDALDFSHGLDDVGLAILDEMHYLGNPDRGSVWEEVVINLPSHMQLVAMSATIANPKEISAWIEAVHGPCITVETAFRPVPLKWWFAWDDGESRHKGSNIAALLDEDEEVNEEGGALSGILKANPKLMVGQTAMQLKWDLRRHYRRLDSGRGNEKQRASLQAKIDALSGQLQQIEVCGPLPCPHDGTVLV
jgi:superfamily II RNA helicase